MYDLCLSVFTEARFDEEQKSKVSGGIEFWQEFGGFLGYIKDSAAVIGVKTNNEKDMRTYLSIKYPGNKQYGREGLWLGIREQESYHFLITDP